MLHGQMLQSIVGGKLTISGGSSAIQLMGTPVSGNNSGTGQVKTLAYTPTATGNALVVYANQDTSLTNCTGLAITNSGAETVEQPAGFPFATDTASIGVMNIVIIPNLATTASHTITITASGSGCAANVYVQGRVEEWQGLVTSSATDETATGTTQTGGTLNSSNLASTTAQAKELAVGLGSCTGGATWSAAGSWTLGGPLDTSTHFNESEYWILSTTQTNLHAQFTYTGGFSCDAIVATFKGN